MGHHLFGRRICDQDISIFRLRKRCHAGTSPLRSVQQGDDLSARADDGALEPGLGLTDIGESILQRQAVGAEETFGDIVSLHNPEAAGINEGDRVVMQRAPGHHDCDVR